MDPSSLLRLLEDIYGVDAAPSVLARLEVLFPPARGSVAEVAPPALSEADVMLIAYPDQIQADGERPLGTLSNFAQEFLADLVNIIHVLPFFPSSSDDGFSVTDYMSVDPMYGDWEDLAHLGQHFGLMYDAVLNHASVQGGWFQRFLRNDPEFAAFFIDVDGKPDLASVVRPRTTPLVTEFRAPDGVKRVWTTFGADQADLNYRNPEVLLRVLGILRDYVEHGARFIRLDAVGYIWKESGTACIHLPQAHAIVSVIGAAVKAVAPHVRIVTETNVAQPENLKYLGEGTQEADLAYNFALPPLLLHAFHTAQATTLRDWAAAVPDLPDGTALLNVLATHDGIGLNGCRGLLPESEIERLTRRVEAAGGYVSRRANSSGGSDPYELNVNYMDALGAALDGAGDDMMVRMFVTAHAVMLALRGVPAIYFHSMFGSRGWHEGAEQSGRPRSINRERLQVQDLRAQLADGRSVRSRVFRSLAGLLKVRRSDPAFSPFADQTVLQAGSGLLVLLRGDEGGPPQVLCLHNVTPERQKFDCSLRKLGPSSGKLRDILHSVDLGSCRGAVLELEPYQSLWLRIAQGEEKSTD
jgi:glucosylglycerate phosphorylase